MASAVRMKFHSWLPKVGWEVSMSRWAVYQRIVVSACLTTRLAQQKRRKLEEVANIKKEVWKRKDRRSHKERVYENLYLLRRQDLDAVSYVYAEATSQLMTAQVGLNDMDMYRITQTHKAGLLMDYKENRKFKKKKPPRWMLPDQEDPEIAKL